MIETSFHLTLITEPLFHKRKAEKLAEIVLNDLGVACELVTIEPYHKFVNSFKIEFMLRFGLLDEKEIIYQSVLVTSKLVSPWLVTLRDSMQGVELLFNKSENTQSRRQEYQTIQWGHWQVQDV